VKQGGDEIGLRWRSMVGIEQMEIEYIHSTVPDAIRFQSGVICANVSKLQLIYIYINFCQ
jgi:hypothetical protein